MDPRDLSRGNGVSLSIDPVYLNGVVPGTNWGVPTESSVVATLDPQVNVQSPNLETAPERPVQFLEHRGRRSLMTDLANEFAVMHDDLLRELAR